MRKGQALVEYALILILISVVSITALMQLGKGITKTFNAINSAMESPASSSGQDNNGNNDNCGKNGTGNGHGQGNNCR